MDKTTFETALKETPDQRIKYLRESLFKPGGVVPSVPAAQLRSEGDEETEPPREYGRRTVKGKLPRKFPPARPHRIINTPEHQAKFDQFILEAPAPEPLLPPLKRKRFMLTDSEDLPPVPVPVPITLKEESEDDMQKKNTRTANPKDLSAPKLSAVDKVFNNLKAIHDRGEELPTHLEYKLKFDKVPPHTFYGGRNKLLKEAKQSARAKANGRGKPAEIFVPAPAGENGNGRARYEAVFESATSPKPEVMAELEKAVPEVLAAFAQAHGLEIAPADFQIRNFAPAGYEIRRVLK